MSTLRLNPRQAGIWLAVLAATMLAASPASARTSVLVYSCGSGFANLCQVNADGSHLKHLTTNGSATAYARKYLSPSLSRDGTRLGYLLGYKLLVLNRVTGHRTGVISHQAMLARISPDGTKVGDIEQFPAAPPYTGWRSTACVFNSNGLGAEAGRDCEGTTGSFGFTNNNRVLAAVSDLYDAGHDRYDLGICLLDPVTSGCDRFLVAQLDYDLSDPAISPNGSLLAVTRSFPGHTQGAIALYDYRTGRLVRTLTGGSTDSGPVWSPDGARLAFVRGATTGTPKIYSVAMKGGTPRLLVAKGRAVTWGW